jgi:hypothetical protein
MIFRHTITTIKLLITHRNFQDDQSSRIATIAVAVVSKVLEEYNSLGTSHQKYRIFTSIL